MSDPSCPTCSDAGGDLATVDLSGVACSETPDWPPSRLGRALLLWLRYRFGAPERITRPALRTAIWTPEPGSPLVIATLAEYDPARDGTRPALLVERSDQDLDLRPLSIGMQRHGAQPNSIVAPLVGQHVIFCLGGREGEADAYAAEIFVDLVAFCNIVASRLGFRRLRPYKVGTRRKLEEYKEIWAVPIFIQYEYDYTTDVRPAAESSATIQRTYISIASAAASG